MFHHGSKLLLGLIAGVVLGICAWQVISFQHWLVLRRAALASDGVALYGSVGSTIPPWLRRVGDVIDVKLPEASRLRLPNWTIFQRVDYEVLCSDEIVQHLPVLTDAPEVDLTWRTPHPEAYPLISKFTRLARLSVRSITLTNADRQALRSLTSVTTLYLTTDQLDRDMIESLVLAPHVNVLEIYASPNNSTLDLADLSPLTHLRTLVLHSDLYTMNLSAVAGSSLTKLDLGEFKVTDDDASLLATLKLEELRIRAELLTSRGYHTLSGIPTLQRVSLHCARLSGDDLDALATLPLTEFVMDDCTLTDNRREAFKRMPGLVGLSIQRTKNAAGIIGQFRNHPRLETLGLVYVPISQAQAAALFTCPRLNKIYLHNSGDIDRVLRASRPEVDILISR